jgi:hypothetical protein
MSVSRKRKGRSEKINRKRKTAIIERTGMLLAMNLTRATDRKKKTKERPVVKRTEKEAGGSAREA